MFKILVQLRSELKKILSNNMIAKSGGFGKGRMSCVSLLLKPNLFSVPLWEIRGCYKLSHAVIDFSKHTTDINRETVVSPGEEKNRLRDLLARADRTRRQR